MGHTPRVINIAQLPLPAAAQHILVRSGDRPLCATLTASPHTDQTVIDTSIDRTGPIARRIALGRTSRADLVDAALADVLGRNGRAVGVLSAEHAARNPVADPQLLADIVAGYAAGTVVRDVAIGAVTNPATPLEARTALDAERYEQLVDVGGSDTDRSVRAFAVIDANRWMADTPQRWGGQLRRAIVALPETDRDTLAAICRLGRSGRKEQQHHPAHHPWVTAEPVDACRLARLSSPAGDWAALDLAQQAADAAGHSTGNGAVPDAVRFIVERPQLHPAPQVIGRIVNRWGLRALVPASGPLNWAGTRLRAAAWYAPMISYRTSGPGRIDQAFIADHQAAVDQLGDHPDAWATYLALLDDWNGSLADAAAAALTLS